MTCLLRSVTKEIIISLQPFHCQLQLLPLASEVTPGLKPDKKVMFKVLLRCFCATVFLGGGTVMLATGRAVLCTQLYCACVRQ